MDTFQTIRKLQPIMGKIFIYTTLSMLVAIAVGISSDSLGQSAGKREDWKSQFSTERPSEVNLRAFENRAIQKLMDVTDYIKIVSNRDLDQKLRTHASKQVTKLFHSETCIVLDPVFTRDTSASNTVVSYMDTLMNSAYHHIVLSAKEIEVKEALIPNIDGTYKGSLTFKGSYFYYESDTKKNNSISVEYIVEVQLKKVAKSFGSNTTEIWVVYLGDFN